MAGEQPYNLFAPCVPGLEADLLSEIRSLGGIRPKQSPGGIRFEANDHVMYRMLIGLGLAIDLRVQLGSFHTTRLSSIAGQVAKLQWSSFIAKGQPVEINVLAKRSKLFHTKAIEERVLEGIQKSIGSLATAGDVDIRWRVYVRVIDDVVSISISVAGEPLHKRGYRLASVKAPLREDLARGIIVKSQWDTTTSFIDLFCGSGTLLIEAARMARKIPAGWSRSFSIEHSNNFDPERFTNIKEAFGAAIVDASPLQILGSDRDEGAIAATLENAQRAGVKDSLLVKKGALKSSFVWDEIKTSTSDDGIRGGLWLSNPPIWPKDGIFRCAHGFI